MAAGENDSLSAEASVFSAGAGGSQHRSAERLATEGNADACAKAQRDASREPTCSVPLRIGLTPIGGRTAGSCPADSDWNGTACVPKQGAPKAATAAPAAKPEPKPLTPEENARLDEQLETLTKLIKNYPKSREVPGAWFKMGEIFQRKGNMKYAIKAYQEAAKHQTYERRDEALMRIAELEGQQ